MLGKKSKWLKFEGRKVKDITGNVYNMLTAIEPVRIHKGQCIWKFKCQCGNEKDIGARAVKSEQYKSCGCLRARMLAEGFPQSCINAAAVANFKDLAAARKKFGRLKPIELWTRKKEVYSGKTRWKNYWECICDCGNTYIVAGIQLVSGRTKSCGCLKSELASARMKKLRATKSLIKKSKSENQICGNCS